MCLDGVGEAASDRRASEVNSSTKMEDARVKFVGVDANITDTLCGIDIGAFVTSVLPRMAGGLTAITCIRDGLRIRRALREELGLDTLCSSLEGCLVQFIGALGVRLVVVAAEAVRREQLHCEMRVNFRQTTDSTTRAMRKTESVVV